MSQTRDFDWSVHDDAAFDRPDSPLPPAQGRSPWWRRLDRRQTTIIVLGAIATVALGLTVERLWQAGQLRRDIQTIVMAEDEPFTEMSWPLGFTEIPAVDSKWVVAVDPVSTGVVRARVAYRIQAEQGASSTWILSQFYRYEGDGWQPVPVERDWLKATVTTASRWIDWQHSPLDTDYVAELAPAMDALVTEACAQAGCPDGLRLRVGLQASRDGSFFWDPSGDRADLVVSRSWASWRAGSVYRPSSVYWGQPGDAVAREFERRRMGLLVLNALQQTLRAGVLGEEDTRSGLYTAFWVRLAARLGLEHSQAPRWQLPDPEPVPDGRWAVQAADPYPYRMAFQGQVLANRLLANQSLAAELRLFQTLLNAAAPAEWLARGLAITPAEARARWEGAFAPIRIDLATRQPQAFVGLCDGVWSTFSAGDQAGTPLVDPGLVRAGWFAAWSPAGRQLVTNSGLLFDFVRGQVSSMGVRDIRRLTWLRDDRLLAMDSIGAGRLMHIDVSGVPTVTWTLTNTHTFTASPDGRWVAAVRGTDLYLINVTEGPRSAQWLGSSSRWSDHDVIWSADSRRLVFGMYHEQGVGWTSVHVVTLTTEGALERRDLPGLGALLNGEGVQTSWVVGPMFGREGDQLTFILHQSEGEQGRTYGVRYDLGDDTLTLRHWPGFEPSHVYTVAGLGALHWNTSARTLAIYEPPTSFALREVSLPSGFTIGPNGLEVDPATGTVLFNSASGPFLWPDPTDPHSSIERLDVPCDPVMINPS